MKVFISWSGELSERVALKLREWLPLVVAGVRPYVSAEDIDKGARWAADIGSELEASAYGVLCLTKENQYAPWILFEAGALSKKLDSSRVSPFLIDLRPAELDRRSPLLQFQATEFHKDHVLKLMQSINRAANSPQDGQILQRQFGAWWPDLERDVEAAVKEFAPQHGRGADAPKRSRSEEMLEELLTLAREQRRMLSEEILTRVGSLSHSEHSLVQASAAATERRSAHLVYSLTKILSVLEAKRIRQPDDPMVIELEQILSALGNRRGDDHTSRLMARARNFLSLVHQVGSATKEAENPS